MCFAFYVSSAKALSIRASTFANPTHSPAYGKVSGSSAFPSPWHSRATLIFPPTAVSDR